LAAALADPAAAADAAALGLAAALADAGAAALAGGLAATLAGGELGGGGLDGAGAAACPQADSANAVRTPKSHRKQAEFDMDAKIHHLH